MNATDIFKREFLRPFLTLAVPGTIAAAPYLLVLFQSYPGALTFWASHPGSSLTFFILFSMAIGLILEDLGIRIEDKCWDRILDRKDRRHLEEWSQYLDLDYRAELNAEDYLRNVLLKLKFELGVSLAIVAAWPGLVWLRSETGIWPGSGFLVASAVALSLVVYLLFESYSSANVLASIRSKIIRADKRRRKALRSR